MGNLLNFEVRRKAALPLLGPGEHARVMVGARPATAWEGPAPAAHAPSSTPGPGTPGGPAAAVTPGDTALAGARLAAALSTGTPVSQGLLVTDQRLLAFRVVSRKRVMSREPGPATVLEATFAVPLPEVVSVVPLGPCWYQIFDSTWRVRLGFADASSVVVNVGRKGNVPLLSGALAGGGGNET